MSTVIDLAGSSDVLDADPEVIEILSSPPKPSIVLESPLKSPPCSPPHAWKRARGDSDLLTSSPLFDHEKRPSHLEASRLEASHFTSHLEASPLCKRHKSTTAWVDTVNTQMNTVNAPVDTTIPATTSPRSQPAKRANSRGLATNLPGAKPPSLTSTKAPLTSTTPNLTTVESLEPDLFVTSPVSVATDSFTSRASPFASRTGTIRDSTRDSTSGSTLRTVTDRTVTTMDSTREDTIRDFTRTISDTASGSTSGSTISDSTPRPIFTDPRSTVTISDSTSPVSRSARQRAKFKDPGPGAGTAAEGPKKSRVAAATKVSDRKSACEKLVCELWTATSSWTPSIAAEFEKLEVAVHCEERPATRPPPGVVLVASAYGNFDDEWDAELGVFVKCAAHREPMATAIVVLEASYMDTLGHLAHEARAAYFAEISTYVHDACNTTRDAAILYIIPEIGAHFRKQAARFDREMRRLVASDSAHLEHAQAPPDEHFYTNLETELQVLEGIRAYYPRKAADAAEMIANCMVDMAHARYHALLDETHDAAGAYVRSKSTTLDVTIESLTKIQGLPPRIAARLGSEARSLGRIRTMLGSNSDMRQSRLKLFGKGSWNEALLTFLEDDDPKRII